MDLHSRSLRMETPKAQPKKPRYGVEMTESRRVNNSASLIQGLEGLFDNPELSDVTVVVGHRRYHLHKLLLTRSEVFKVMLLGPQWSDSLQREIHLEELEECEQVAEDFLRYFYSGQIDLSRHNVIPVLILANKYNVKDLEQSCEQYAASLVFSGTNIEQVVEWWIISKQLNLRLLRRKCREYMLLNFDLTIKSDCFLDFEISDLKWFLSQADLVVTSEFVLYHSVLDWLHHQKRKDHYLHNLQELASLVRFCMMSTDELVQVEEGLSKQDGVIIRPYLFEAFKYHAIPFHGREKANMSKYDKPRLYTGIDTGVEPPICKTLYLQQSDRKHLQEGVKRVVQLPVSMSSADQQDCREWFLSFHQAGENSAINLEVSSTDNSNHEQGTIEASVLIYKQVNSITFVKGVMQFRCYTRTLANSPSSSRVGHIFSVVVPAEAMLPNSPYQIKDGCTSKCMFKLVVRNFQENQVVSDSPPQCKLSPEREAQPTFVLPTVENIGTRSPSVTSTSTGPK